MQTTDVDILVALDAVLEALVEALALLRGGEDSRDSSRNGRLLLGQGTELCVGDTLALGRDLSDDSRTSKLLRRRGGVAGAVSGHDARGLVSIAHGAEEGSARGRLGSGGGVGSPTVVQAWDISLATLEAITTVGGSTTRSVGKHVVAVRSGDATLLHIGVARDTTVVGLLSHDHIVGALGVSTIAGVGDRNVRRGHVAVGRHDGGSSALGHVTISHAESTERTDKTTEGVLVGLVVHAPSNVVTSLVAVGGDHVLALAVGVLAGHDGGVEVRHGRFLHREWSAISITRRAVFLRITKGVVTTKMARSEIKAIADSGVCFGA